MASDSLDIENLFRPIYEVKSALWSFFSALTVVVMGFVFASNGWHLVVSAGLFSFALFRCFQGKQLFEAQRRIITHKLTFVNLSRLQEDEDSFYIGTGYTWGAEHAQRAYVVNKMSTTMEELGHTGLMGYFMDRLKDEKLKTLLGGKPWIHGLGHSEDVLATIDSLRAHVGIIGSTGSGKTRLLELLTSQSVFAKEAIVVVDPKGDVDLHERLKKCLEVQGRPDDYYYFNPAKPELSCRIDVLANFNRSTEIASRISSLIASDSPSDPFINFCWRALSTVTDGMLGAGVKPSLKLFRKYMEGGVDGLLVSCIEAFLEDRYGEGWREKYATKINTLGGDKGWDAGLVSFYKNLNEEEAVYEGSIDSLLNMAEHDRAHFSKMIGTLLPLLVQLTAGPLEALMSPDYEDLEDTRPIVNGGRIVTGGKCLVVALDSLSDSVVGGAIGSIVCADIVSVAGMRQNYTDIDKEQACCLYIDEAASVINRPIIELLNKGRGAKVRVCLATQTVPDFIARLGNESLARMVLGNINTLFALRVTDSVSSEYCVEAFGKTAIAKKTKGLNYGSSSHEAVASYSGGYREQVAEEEGDLFAASLISSLPNLEYVARLADGRVVKGRIPLINDDMEPPEDVDLPLAA